MYTSLDQEQCAGAGVECAGCVRASGQALARLSPGLSAKTVLDFFFRMYSSPECVTSAANFELAYRQAARLLNQEPVAVQLPLEPIPPRPAGPQLVRLGASAA